MTRYLYANNATTTLAQSVSATATIINVASGEGDLFPSPTDGEAFAITFVDAATGLQNEIAYCTNRSGDTLTVVRGQENKNARAWVAGDTVANYITAGVIESWLQEADLDGYATESWANDQFLQLSDADTQTVTGPVTFSGITTVPTPTDYSQKQAIGASDADARYVKKTGDIMTGGLTIDGNTGGFISRYSPGNPAVGDYINYPGFTSVAEGRGAQLQCYLQEIVGTQFGGIIALVNGNGSVRYIGIPWGNRINDSVYGNVAYTSDLPTAGTITGGTYTKTPMNDGTGRSVLRQTFSVSNVAGGDFVTFPISYTVTPNVSVTQGDNLDSDSGLWGATTSGFYIFVGSDRTTKIIIAEGIL